MEIFVIRVVRIRNSKMQDVKWKDVAIHDGEKMEKMRWEVKTLNISWK